MKSLFVITRHAICNYGSLLQSIATIHYFESKGFDTYIIDYISNEESVIKNLINYANNRKLSGIKRLVYYVLKFPEEQKKYFQFQNMRKKYLKMTTRYSSETEMSEKFNGSILCSGGDQLWGYMPNMHLDDAYYLNFGNETNQYISLSSSFGRYDFNNLEIMQIKKNLIKYNFITVREASAKNFLSNLGIKSHEVLDPTLLVDKQLWLGMCDSSYASERYVLVYKLRQDDKLVEFANVISKKLNVKIIYITNSSFNRSKNGKTLINPDISTVLSLFKHAQMVITDSFHATVLATIYEKDFYVHLPNGTGARIVDFVEKLKLDNRIIDNSYEINIENKIDYQKVNSLLKEERAKSDEIISKMLDSLK